MMLIPKRVAFGGVVWPGAMRVTIDRAASRLIEEWGDEGPFAVLIDAPEVRTVIKVELVVSSADPPSPLPGSAGALTAEFGPSSGDLIRQRLTVQAVVVQSVHTIASDGIKRVVTLRAQSTDGGTDPVSIEPIG